MMAAMTGFAIAFGALLWVLWPVLRGRRGARIRECAECGVPLEQDARFCAECGTPVAA